MKVFLLLVFAVISCSYGQEFGEIEDEGKEFEEVFHQIRATANAAGCGTSKFERNFGIKIVGGRNADHGEWPWQISMRYKLKHTCGGSLIHPQWVLTAAHCVSFAADSMLPTAWKVVLGDLSISRREGTEVEVGVSRVIRHEQYNAKTINHDIALLKLTQPVNLNNYINIVCLPEKTTSLPAGEVCTTTGWGNTRWQGTAADHLQVLQVPLIAPQTCNNNYAFVNPITTNMICAGYQEGGKGTCQGDSGGPLVCKIGGRWTLMGATSWGVECAKRGYPGVFARVTQYRDWVNSKLALN